MLGCYCICWLLAQWCSLALLLVWSHLICWIWGHWSNHFYPQKRYTPCCNTRDLLWEMIMTPSILATTTPPITLMWAPPNRVLIWSSTTAIPHPKSTPCCWAAQVRYLVQSSWQHNSCFLRAILPWPNWRMDSYHRKFSSDHLSTAANFNFQSRDLIWLCIFQAFIIWLNDTFTGVTKDFISILNNQYNLLTNKGRAGQGSCMAVGWIGVPIGHIQNSEWRELILNAEERRIRWWAVQDMDSGWWQTPPTKE